MKFNVKFTENIAKGKDVCDEEDPRTEPWGTPEVTGDGWERKDLIVMN